MKLNIGCGAYPIPGYVNIDQHCPADIQGDFMEMSFSGVSRVFASHILEHLPWRRTGDALRLIYGWLICGGTLAVEVPDFRALCEMYLSGKITGDVANQWIFGEQGIPGEFHCSAFTAESLRASLGQAGFASIEVDSFISSHPARVGYPCISAVAQKA